MNYTFQSFNFRARQGARPFYDLVANIAAEEFGHVELVAATINTMLTGAGREGAPCPSPATVLNPQQFIAGGRGRAGAGLERQALERRLRDLVRRPRRRPDSQLLPRDRARNNKLKVYEMVDHPAARALTGYLLVRGGVHQVAYARAVEKLTGADLSKLFPSPRIPTDKIPECQPHIERGEHLKLYRFSPSDFLELAAVFNGPHPETGDELEVVDDSPEGVPAVRPAPAGGVFAPDYAPEEIAEIARRLRQAAGFRTSPPAWSPTTPRHHEQGQGGRLLAMATLTKLESKWRRSWAWRWRPRIPAARCTACWTASRRGFPRSWRRPRRRPGNPEAVHALASSIKGKKTAILEKAREVKREATEMRETDLRR